MVSKGIFIELCESHVEAEYVNYLTLPNEFNGVTVRAVVEVTKGTQVRREVEAKTIVDAVIKAKNFV